MLATVVFSVHVFLASPVAELSGDFSDGQSPKVLYGKVDPPVF